MEIKIADRSNTKPIYLIVVEDPTTKEKQKIKYYISKRDIFETSNTIKIKGFLLDSKQAEKLEKQTINATYENLANNSEISELDLSIPAQRVIRIENVTYKNPQGEK